MQACFALWNLACQNSDNQRAISRAGAIKPLVGLLSKGSASVQEEAAGALMNLAALAENKRAIAGANAVDALVPMLKVGGGVSEQARDHAEIIAEIIAEIMRHDCRDHES